MAVSIKFERCGVSRGGEILYRLIIGGRTVREDLSIDQVVEVINRRDEESLGAAHGAGRIATPTCALARNDRNENGCADDRNGGEADGHDHV